MINRAALKAYVDEPPGRSWDDTIEGWAEDVFNERAAPDHPDDGTTDLVPALALA